MKNNFVSLKICKKTSLPQNKNYNHTMLQCPHCFKFYIDHDFCPHCVASLMEKTQIVLRPIPERNNILLHTASIVCHPMNCTRTFHIMQDVFNAQCARFCPELFDEQLFSKKIYPLVHNFDSGWETQDTYQAWHNVTHQDYIILHEPHQPIRPVLILRILDNVLRAECRHLDYGSSTLCSAFLLLMDCIENANSIKERTVITSPKQVHQNLFHPSDQDVYPVISSIKKSQYLKYIPYVVATIKMWISN